MLHTLSILLGTEDTYLAVTSSECLQPFEGLLTVVKAGRCHRDGDHIRGGDFPLPPLAIAVVAADIVVCREIPEAQRGPIELVLVFHNRLL